MSTSFSFRPFGTYLPQEKTALSQLPYIDGWLPVRYAFNFYSGCTFGCSYCPANWQSTKNTGKAHKQVLLNDNLRPLLRNLLSSKTLQLPVKLPAKELVGFGIGVQDPFMPFARHSKIDGEASPQDGQSTAVVSEKQFAAFSHAVLILLEQLLYRGNSVIILTKNPSFFSDSAVFFRLAKNSKALSRLTLVCSLPFPSFANQLHASLEQGVPTPEERLRSLNVLSQSGVRTGIAYLPIIPGVNDSKEIAIKVLNRAAQCGATFAIFGSISDKALLRMQQSSSIPAKPWTPQQRLDCEQTILEILRKQRLLPLLPLAVYRGNLSKRNETIAYLQQSYLYHSYHSRTIAGYRMAAESLEAINDHEFLQRIRGKTLQKLAGIGGKIDNTIENLVKHGNFSTIKFFEKSFS